MVDLKLDGRQTLALLDQVDSLYGHTDAITLASTSIDMITWLTRADRVAFAITDNPGGRCAAVFWPVGTDLPNYMPSYERLWAHNPVGNRHNGGEHCEATRVSDCLPHDNLERSEFYNEYMRPAHLKAFMTAYMGPTQGYRLALTAFREGGDFTDVEKGRLELARRHIVRAFRTSITIGRMTSNPVRAHDLFKHPTLPSGHVIKHSHFPEPSIFPNGLGPRLSKREAEVLHWLCHGKTNPEIGTILGCAPRTVQKHVEHLFQKMNVTTRTAAGIEAVRLGLHTPRAD